MLAGVEALAEQEAEPLEHPDDAREEPPRAAEGVVVVVRPAQAEPVLPRLLDPRGPVARLPVVALDLEDEVAGQVGIAGQLDHAVEGRLGRVEPLGVVVESAPTALPELARGQGVARRVRRHPPPAGEVAGERLEPR